MTENTATYAILLGADMAPDRIRTHAALAEGRFTGIGAVASRDMAGLQLPLPQADEVWGVVVQLPADAQIDGPAVPVSMRTGEHVEAAVLTTPGDLDDREAVLTEAYYWELPATYREALER